MDQLSSKNKKLETEVANNLFFFFSTTHGEDPPVFRFLEGDDTPKKMADSFTVWIQNLVSEEVAIFKDEERSRSR